MPSQEEGSDAANTSSVFPARKIIKKKNGKQETIRDSVRSPSEAAEDISIVKRKKDEDDDQDASLDDANTIDREFKRKTRKQHDDRDAQ